MDPRAHCALDSKATNSVPRHRHQVLEKLDVIRSRGYVGEGQVESVMCFFAAQKGASDIRMVYDGTRSGLNNVLWGPWFPLPTVNSRLRRAGDVHGRQ